MLQFNFILALKFILLLTWLTFGYMRYQNVHLSLHTIINFIILKFYQVLNLLDILCVGSIESGLQHVVTIMAIS